MKLIKMTASEFEFWGLRSQQSYAENKVRANQLTQIEADKIAERDFQRLLPDGLNSKDNFLFSMKNEDLTIVGYLWFQLSGPFANRKAFLYDIIIEESFRGQGFGKVAMQLLEEEVKKLGINHIGLHVFASNAPALRLYQALGYQTTDLVMAKNLT